MDNSFHYLSMISHTLFQKKVLNKLLQYGLTPGQPKVLDYLISHDGSIQREIAQGCQIDPATLTGILERMEEKGLVERRLEKGNRRSSYVYLTKDGKEKGQVVSEVFREIEADIFKDVLEKDREVFMKVFFKICCNMRGEGENE